MKTTASPTSTLNPNERSGASNIQWASQSNLTPAQRQLWLGQKLSPDSPLYNMAFLFSFSGEVDIPHFQSAFQSLVQQCDALRMVIEEKDGIPQQRVLPQIDYSMPVVDFEPSAHVQDLVRAWAEARAQKLFNLSEKLFDTALICCSKNNIVWYLNQHHLITDMVSLKRLYEMMSDFYERSHSGTLDQAPKLPAYADIVLPPPSDRAIQYWQAQQLTPSPLYHRSLPHQPDPLSHRLSCSLSPQQTAALKKLAMDSEATALTPQLSLFNLVAAIVLAYLHRISGQQQVAFATPAQGRPSASLKETIGLFIELFPLSVEIDPNETFASLMTKTSAASGGLLRSAQSGASEFTHGRNVNVVLNFLHAKISDFAGHPTSAEWIHSGASDPHHHLRILAHDFDDRGYLQLHFDFNSDLFEPELQERAPSHFLAMVDAVLENRAQPIAQVDLLTESEKYRLGELGRCPQTDTVRETVVQQFEAQVEKTPTAIALSYSPLATQTHPSNASLTYQQLSDRANQLAHWLIDQGIVAEAPIALYFRRSPEMLIALWGVLKAGATYIPLDPGYPDERIAHILEDTQSGWVLTHSKLNKTTNILARTTPRILTLDTLDLDAQPTSNPPAPTLNQRAYCLYTSGSTGQPKGVEIEHRSLSNYIQWAQQQYIRDRVLTFPLFSSLAFDLTVTSIYLPLISGGKIIIYPEDQGSIDFSLPHIFQDNLVDVVKLTPSHLALMKGMPVDSRIKTLISGGEDLKSSLVKEIFDREGADPELEIYNEYGPTEATVGCMIQRCDSALSSLEDFASVPIGQAAAGADIYLLDDCLNRVPWGDVGEIFIGGPGLARGYLNQPELTAKRFVWRAGERLYRTGDLGRWEENGKLTYLGRCDRQIKLHGLRIEPGEIEAALMTHPRIDDCVVSTYLPDKQSKQASATQQLVAYYTSDIPTLSPDEIKGLVTQQLPQRIHPSYFIRLDRIPLTHNGKVDTAALPSPKEMSRDSTQSQDTPTFVAPQTPIEKTLAGIWQQVLNMEAVGRHDSFFELGGDSIAAIQIAARAGDAGLEISPNQIFQCATLIELAGVIRQKRDADNAPDANVSEPADSTQPYAFKPISSGQLDRISQLLDSADAEEGSS